MPHGRTSSNFYVLRIVFFIIVIAYCISFTYDCPFQRGPPAAAIDASHPTTSISSGISKTDFALDDEFGIFERAHDWQRYIDKDTACICQLTAEEQVEQSEWANQDDLTDYGWTTTTDPMIESLVTKPWKRISSLKVLEIKA
ncbi:MAG: hypothetical protein M1820_005149 [Bogoriella megaspora]|nr:MAG: hypothetical protein M1820_005149 [Bogoriella megaspora]